MTDTPYQADFLRCIYDEAEPRGQIGRGTHYSVFRAASWLGETGKMRPTAWVQDFAVIWDEDHDQRIINVVERMYMAGLLYPVLFIGERKGGLTVVLSEGAARSMEDADRKTYEKKIAEIAGNVPTDGDTDSWSVEIGKFDSSPMLFSGGKPEECFGMLVHDDKAKTGTYLRNIHNLWSLGHKPFKTPKPVIPASTKTPSGRLFEADAASS